MLPESMQNFLGKCDKSRKGTVLKMIASLTTMNGFAQAVKTIDHALEYEITDSDSLLSLHKRIHTNYDELPPIKLTDNIPEVLSVIPDFNQYDQKLESSRVRI